MVYCLHGAIPLEFILNPLFFFIYINDLSEVLTANTRLIADDVSLFSVADNINFDLSKINAWANQGRMTFKPDPNKEVQEVIFSHKLKKTSHFPLNFNNNSSKSSTVSKTLGHLSGR